MSMPRTSRSSDVFAVVAALLVSSGCDDSVDDEGAPLATRGAITVAVANTSGADVFINATFGVLYALDDGPSAVHDRHDCTILCSDGCSCMQCGPPQDQVRRIPDGGSLDVTWDGYTYERVVCGDDVSCDCDQVSAPELGTYTFRLSGRLAMDPPDATATGSDPDLFVANLDATSDECTAELALELTESAQQVSASFTCP